MSESSWKKPLRFGSKIWQFCWSLVYPKCSKLEVYNPWVMMLEICSIICKSNDPQIFIYRKSCGFTIIIHEAWRMLWGLCSEVQCTLPGLEDVLLCSALMRHRTVFSSDSFLRISDDLAPKTIWQRAFTK